MKHLPRIAGPWLAGSYDSDRAAAKAAQDALNLVFPTLEKTAGLRKTFHGPILEYCRDAVLHETAQTLSDERTVSPDDAQATYTRVVATSLAVVMTLLYSLPEEDTSKQYRIYEEIFGDNKLWDFANHSDVAIRRSLHRLVQSTLSKQAGLVETNLKTASTAYIYKGLASDQSGSAADYLGALDALTSSFPAIWTDAYSGKKPAMSRLRQLLKHGSRSGAADYWERLRQLLTKIPQQVLPKTYEEANDLLLAARDGASRREERFNASAAWPAYFTLVAIALAGISDVDSEKLLDCCVMPIIRQYLSPSPETADWTINGSKAASLVAEAARVPKTADLLEHEWPQLADQLIEIAKISQPQQSKDFERSQMHVAAAGERWAVLQSELFTNVGQQSPSLHEVFVATNVKIAKECTQLLETREGKPFGAAAIIEELLRTCAPYLITNADFKVTVEQLLTSDRLSWISWPSRRHLIRCLHAVSAEPFYGEAFKGALDEATEQGESSVELRDFFPRNTPKKAIEIARQHTRLQDLVLRVCRSGPNDLQSALFVDLNRLGALAENTVDQALSSLVNSLAVTEGTEKFSCSLDFFCSADDDTLKAATASSNGEQLLPNLLRLEQHQEDDIAQKATSVSSRLSSAGDHATSGARFSVVLQNLESVSRTSLSIDALHDLTSRLLGPERKVQDPNELLPNLELWLSALQTTVRPPSPSLALLSPLGGAVHLVQTKASQARMNVQLDAEGLSHALRIAMYVSKLLAETDMRERLHEVDDMWIVVSLLYTTVLLAEENLGILGTNALWNPNKGGDVEPAVLDFITETNVALNYIWATMTPELKPDGEQAAAGSSEYRKLLSAFSQLSSSAEPSSDMYYYVVLASARINANLFEIHGHNADQAKSSEALLRQHRSTRDSLATSASIVGLQQPLTGSQSLTRLCNELVADLTALDVSDSQHEQKALDQLVQLNLILQTQEDAVTTIAKQRLIFLVKRLVPSLNTGTTLAITAEICKALAALLPGMQDMYGEHWAQVLSYLLGFWTSMEGQTDGAAIDERRILLTHASLRLYSTLTKLTRVEEPNDDLVDALKDNSDQIYDGLVLLLKSANGVSDETHQPLMITHELLGRQIAQLPYRSLRNADELYPLLYTPCRPVQQAAFDLLHKHIPAAQEQVSFDTALENKTAHLPDELLSLILEAPTLDSLVDASFDRTMPLQLQGYLYSWRLLFDHFSGSSYRVKTDYIEQLKEGMYLSGLLSFTFDFLGHSRGKPVDASKFEIQEYFPDTEPSPERDVQWALTHLFYLALMHLPSLVKSYYLDIRSRQTSLAVENWTAKYISPLIINASLQAVAEWSEKSVKEDPEYEKMSVKVGMRSKEINVSYVVDEQTMAIKVVLPEAYPLASAQVVGVSRVAVKEEKWQSWLRNCQGVITFSVSLPVRGTVLPRMSLT